MIKYFTILVVLFLLPALSFSQDNSPYLSFGLHGGTMLVDNKPTSVYYSSTGPFLEAEFAVNINRSFAPFISFVMGTIREREFSLYTEKTFLMHYRFFDLGFRYTYNLNNKFGIFAQIQAGLGTQKSLDKTPPHEFNFGDNAGDISIGLGLKYSIIKSLEVSTKAKFHGPQTYSFFGGLNFNLPEIKK